MSDLSHDLKSPLVKIKAIVAILLRDQQKKELSGQEIRDYLKRIDESATGLNDLIDRKLSF